MLTDAERAMMRSTQIRYFDRTATISTPNFGDDGAGGQSSAAPTTLTVPCRMIPHRSTEGEQVIAAKAQGRGLWDIKFAVGTAVKQNSEITIDGKVYAVMTIRGPHSFDTTLVVLCMEKAL